MNGGHFGIDRLIHWFNRYSSSTPSINGNASSGRAFDLMGISPLRGSLRGALPCYDGSRHIAASTLDFRTGRKYHYCFCLSSPSVRVRRTVRAYARVACPRGQQKEGKGCDGVFGCQGSLASQVREAGDGIFLPSPCIPHFF